MLILAAVWRFIAKGIRLEAKELRRRQLSVSQPVKVEAREKER